MGHYPRQKSANAPSIIVIIAILAVAGITVYMIAPRMLLSVEDYADQTLTVEKGAYGNVSALVETGKTLEVAVDVMDGGTVDVFLMSSQDKISWDKYVEGQLQSFTYISQGSALKTKLFRYTFIVPQRDTYFVIVSNRGGIPAGAVSTGEVVAHVKILTGAG